MQCPRCRRSMVVYVHHDIHLDHCKRCRGLWFDRGELELCPRCPEMYLQAGGLGKIPMHHCSRCEGLWLHDRAIKIMRSFKRLSDDIGAEVVDFTLEIGLDSALELAEGAG